MLYIRKLRRPWWTFIILTCLLSTSSLATEPVPPNDMLNAEVWMQTAIEYRANCLTIYALANKNWPAYDQTGDSRNLPPAVILDLDETALDNSPYEASLVVNGAAHFN